MKHKLVYWLHQGLVISGIFYLKLLLLFVPRLSTADQITLFRERSHILFATVLCKAFIIVQLVEYQVVEQACGTTNLLLGETMPNISREMDSYSIRIPLGVTAGVCPFNFPAMIPLWMFPMSLVCGLFQLWLVLVLSRKARRQKR